MRSLMALNLLLIISLQATAADWDYAELMALLAIAEASEQDYTETKELAFLDAPEVSQGRLSFSPPDRLVKQVEKPSVSRYEITGGQMTITRSGQAEQVVDINAYPLLQIFIETLRAVLTGDLKSLKQYYAIELTGMRSAWQLQLTPQDSQLAELIDLLTISGRDKQIEQIVTQEQGGDRTTLILHSGSE